MKHNLGFMNINWYGKTCFRILSQRNKNGLVNILIDPYGKESGFRSPKLESDIILCGHDDGSKKEVPDNSFLIDGPGEYDLKGAYIQGLPSSIFVIDTEEIRICHLGLFNQKELTTEQLEEMGQIDILMIPIGGGDVLDAKGAVKIMSQIEPKITIPMYYKTPRIDSQKKLDGVDKLLAVLGVKSLQPIAKLSIRKKEISQEEAKIIILES